MKRIADANGFSSRLFLTTNATRAAFESVWQDAIATLGPGDIFLLTVAGHGGELRSQDSDEPIDQTLCLYDFEWLDDQTYALLSRMPSGVRILGVFDTCHSQTQFRIGPRAPVFRGMPKNVAKDTYTANRKYYDAAAYRARRDRGEIKATAMSLSACKDPESAADGANNGLFTEVLLKAWNNGSFTGDYRGFHRSIEALMPRTVIQHPTLTTYGDAGAVQAFLGQTPFSARGSIAMSEPSVSSSSTQGSAWTWGIPRDNGAGTGAGRGTRGSAGGRGSRRKIDTGTAKRTRVRERTEPSADQTAPDITLRLQSLLADQSGMRGATSLDDVLTNLGELYTEGGRLEWVPPDDVDTQVASYLSASVQELNNRLDVGIATIDDNGVPSLTQTGIVPDGSYVASIDAANELYVVRDGRRQVVQDRDEVTSISQADVQLLEASRLMLIPLEPSASRAVGRDLYTYLWSDLKSGHFMQSWVWLQGNTLTARTITETVTWLGGWTAGCRVDLYDADGNQIRTDPIRFRYGCDGRLFGSGRRDETEVVQVPQEAANAAESILISHYWDPKRNLGSTGRCNTAGK